MVQVVDLSIIDMWEILDFTVKACLMSELY